MNADVRSVLSDATHASKGVDEFPIPIARMRDGTFVINPTPWPIPDLKKSLHDCALEWIGSDRKVRDQEEREGKRTKVRGARYQVLSVLCATVQGP